MKKEKGKETKKKLPVWAEVLIWVFFPIGLLRLGYSALSKRFRMDITTKTTLLNSVLFFFLVAGYAAFVIANVATAAAENSFDGLVVRLVITSVIIVVVYVAVFVAFCTLTSRSMLSPVRKMMEKMDEISGEDLSERLDPVDSQDELTELTDRINAMLDDIEESFKRQRNFVSDASHELRTPISVVQGYSDLLARWGKEDPAVLDESISAIRAEAANMKAIVEQLLYLARLGSFKPQVTEFDLAEAVRDIVDAYDMTGARKTINLESEDTVTVAADRALTFELIRIITDNAIKYTRPGGRITVRVRSRAGAATVVVEDDGIGISAEDLPHIFDRFYRCDKARGRESGSTGLGLAIARSIAEMMGGSISVRSELGRGSEFTVTLPAEQ